MGMRVKARATNKSVLEVTRVLDDHFEAIPVDENLAYAFHKFIFIILNIIFVSRKSLPKFRIDTLIKFNIYLNYFLFSIRRRELELFVNVSDLAIERVALACLTTRSLTSKVKN